MENKTTDEVNPSDLSEETVCELVEEGCIDELEAEKLEEQIWFKEIDTPNPSEKRTFKQHIVTVLSSKFDAFKTFISNSADEFMNKRTAFVKIDSVEKTQNNEIKLYFSHPKSRDGSTIMSPDSNTLGNIMELAEVQNPKNLEGSRLISKRDDGQFSTVKIPRNVSTFGKMRYKSYSVIKELYEKTRIASINGDSAYCVFMGSVLSAIPVLIGTITWDMPTLVSVILVTPFFIGTLILSIFALYGIKRVAMGLLGTLLRGEMKEKIAR
jgi:hypothetical protein